MAIITDKDEVEEVMFSFYMQPFYLFFIILYLWNRNNADQRFIFILLVNLYMLTISTISTFIDAFDGKYPELRDDVFMVFFWAVQIVSVAILLKFFSAWCLEWMTGRRQAALHPGLTFDAREHFDKMPVIIYQPFTNLKSKNCAIWLMDYEPEDSIKVLPVCFHTFHTEWIRLWFVNNSTCPFWRRVFTEEDINNSKDMSEDEIYRWIQASTVRPSFFNPPHPELEDYQRSSRELPYNPVLPARS